MMLDYAQARRTMVDCQLRTFDVVDIAVLAAMDRVPREAFVPEGWEDLAYSDQPIPLDAGEGAAPGRKMLTPMVLGRLLQELRVRPGVRALDVGCGLGYSSAVLAELGALVVALEETEGLADSARGRLGTRENVLDVQAGPLPDGSPSRGPFDVILVNGLVEERPEALLGQLAEGGRLACIQRIGAPSQAMLYLRSGDAFAGRPLFNAAAPTLRGFEHPPGFVFELR